MTQKLTHGCKAKYVYGSDAYDYTVTAVIDHPTAPGMFIVVTSGPFGENLWKLDSAGQDDFGDLMVQSVDAAKEAWDKLDSAVREVLSHTARTRKITAIKAFRALSGLGLTDAKRAIEEFSA